MLIEDVRPAYLRGYGKSRLLKHFRTDAIIAELYRRGVSMEDIFRFFYECEEMASARDDERFGNDEEGQHGLTVGDAQLIYPSQFKDKKGRVF